jgi:hypothetical protein
VAGGVMPSGNTHILLVKNIPEDQLRLEIKNLLDAGIYFLQVGAVAPDLPYASIADSDLFLHSQMEVADDFHYKHTNQIPLLALQEIKLSIHDYSKLEQSYLFSFFCGYISHVVADGVMHPFVLDKVGEYKTHAKEHRILEMQLDVIFYHHLSLASGIPGELNRAKICDELKNLSKDKETLAVMKVFSKTIQTVYGVSFTEEKIIDWASGLHNLFQASEGKFPQVLRGINFIKSYLSPLYEDIKHDEENILTLKSPTDPHQKDNFLKKEQIHFINDCVPQFYAKFIPLVSRAYNYIFENGPALTEDDIFGIDLDTGRPIAQHNQLDLTPSFWS